MLSIARIHKATGTVFNIEMADSQWLDANIEDPTFHFVVYGQEQPAWIGLRWSAENGFEQPPTPEVSDATE